MSSSVKAQAKLSEHTSATSLTYDKAKAQAKKEKPQGYYWLIEIDYDKQLILPYKAGLQFMEALEAAERLVTWYGKSPVVEALPKEMLQFRLLAREEYLRYRTAQLLRVTLDDLPTD